MAGRALDVAGLGPMEAPFRTVVEAPAVRLRAYQERRAGRAPALLIIPAPIKRAYIWDLLPEVSVIRRFLARGMQVYLLEWLPPHAAEDELGLPDYADRLPGAALDAIAAETGRATALLAGHSLGGTFAAVFAALHPERVGGLILVDAPLAFGAEGGPLVRAVAGLPDAGALAKRVGGPMPGSLLGLLAAASAPADFIMRRWIDQAASLADGHAAAIHARVERWMLDELPLPGRLFADVIEQLYRGDRFAAGRLELDGRRAAPDRLACPVAAVVNEQSSVVPPASLLAGLAKAANQPVRVLRYQGDRGCAIQHVGPLVAPAAHQRLWPEIVDWAVASDGTRRK